MYTLEDTVFAVATPFGPGRCILRVTGPRALDIVNGLLAEPICKQQNGLIATTLMLAPDLCVEASLYLFFQKQSYTGQTLLEIHLQSNPSLTEALIIRLQQAGARDAGPGEFTARAYLNGKIDLAQAEAVNEIIAATNSHQLTAAEKLLSGKLASKTSAAQSALLDLLGLLEATLDFSQEDIELISTEQAIDKLMNIRGQLAGLVQEECQDEALIHLPSVGIAGSPNAGKSSLFNALLKRDRSITSSQQNTTRDVLSDTMALAHTQCVLFDCAGLCFDPEEILQQLAQEAALESLRHCNLVLFCVDVSKGKWQEDLAVFQNLTDQTVMLLATKSDGLGDHEAGSRQTSLAALFGRPPLLISSRTSFNLTALTDRLEQTLQQLSQPSRSGSQGPDLQDTPFLTLRHRQALAEAIDNIDLASHELNLAHDEVATMMMRAAIQALGDIEQHIDDTVLDRIFAQFCIGK
jgi:tRNA modification GTPase